MGKATKKIIRYRLPISRTFPATHKKAGESTFFVEEIYGVLANRESFETIYGAKIHTIRGNYELWAKRFEKIEKGEAVLELYYWSGKPYNSKTETICQLSKDDGIGIQKASFFDIENLNGGWCYIIGDFIPDGFGKPIPVFDTVFMEKKMYGLAKNDGLSPEDFKEWFKKYDLSKPMAIIHFTNFRY